MSMLNVLSPDCGFGINNQPARAKQYGLNKSGALPQQVIKDGAQGILGRDGRRWVVDAVAKVWNQVCNCLEILHWNVDNTHHI